MERFRQFDVSVPPLRCRCGHTLHACPEKIIPFKCADFTSDLPMESVDSSRDFNGVSNEISGIRAHKSLLLELMRARESGGLGVRGVGVGKCTLPLVGVDVSVVSWYSGQIDYLFDLSLV